MYDCCLVPEAEEEEEEMGYTLALFTLDLFAALVSRPDGGILSGRPLGSNITSNLWTPDKIGSFYNGVMIAHNNFFSEEELGLKDFAQVIISESCQECLLRPRFVCVLCCLWRILIFLNIVQKGHSNNCNFHFFGW